MHSARNVHSEEARSHLHNARQRVMSVASLQFQLATSSAADVALRPYFTTLCQSIGAPMIRDHDTILLGVTADDRVTAAAISVSLGLIVTELVINALEHAFPGDRSGKVMVSYQSQGPNWTLSVCDNGVGMPTSVEDAKPSLGTSIVQALAGQLQSVIKVTDANPGTAVSIAHLQLAVVHSEAINKPINHAV